MNKTAYTRPANLLMGASLGALVMWLLDDRHGRRQVALVRDQATRLARAGRQLADIGSRDLVNRATGVVSRLSHVMPEADPLDDVLVDRVRARLGRLVSHPRAIHVAAEGGRVILSGPIIKAEVRQVVRGVETVRGVREVEDRLEPHTTDDGLPALQGGKGRPVPPQAEFMQQSWAPGPRLLAVAAGTALAGFGASRRTVSGGLLGLAGMGLAARGMTNTELLRLLGLARGRRGLALQKTITIAAPRERVFDLWADYDNFPRFMSFVEAVRRLDDSRSHWVVKGPGGAHFEWDSTLTQLTRPEVLAWRSDPGAAVQHAGIVRFDEVKGGTRVALRMSYDLPGGMLAHSLAALLGRQPKQALDADLMRMKTFIETGAAPRDAAARAA